MHRSLHLSLLLTCTSLAAQSEFVRPAAYASSDAPGVFGVRGIGLSGRTQILMDESILGVGSIGRTITEIAFRRDRVITRDVPATIADVTVTLSPSTRSAIDAATSFEMNAGPSHLRTVVYQGALAVPASSDPSARSADWSDPQDVVRIPLQVPFVYGGDSLCLDIQGATQSGQPEVDWPVDGIHSTTTASSIVVGSPCTRVSPTTEYLGARASTRELVAGSTATVWARGEDGVATALVLGGAIPPVDLGLFGLGSSGCILYTDPALSIGSSYVANPLQASEPGATIATASVDLQIPADAGATAVTLRAQFINLSFPLETTNAVDFTTAANVPTHGVSTIRAGLTATDGRVSTTWFPVMRWTTTP